MPDSNEVKRIMNLQVEGKTPVGRPKLTWQRAVDEDLKRLHLKKVDAEDKVKFRTILREVQPQQLGIEDSK